MRKQSTLKHFKPGTEVQWNWMGRVVKGSVKQIYFRPIAKTFRETLFKRNGSPETPAYLVKSHAGSDVLKLHTELRATRGTN